MLPCQAFTHYSPWCISDFLEFQVLFLSLMIRSHLRFTASAWFPEFFQYFHVFGRYTCLQQVTLDSSSPSTRCAGKRERFTRTRLKRSRGTPGASNPSLADFLLLPPSHPSFEAFGPPLCHRFSTCRVPLLLFLSLSLSFVFLHTSFWASSGQNGPFRHVMLEVSAARSNHMALSSSSRP